MPRHKLLTSSFYRETIRRKRLRKYIKIEKALRVQYKLSNLEKWEDALNTSIFLKQINLHIRTIPKTACTSLKYLLSCYLDNKAASNNNRNFQEMLKIHQNMEIFHPNILMRHTIRSPSVRSISFVRNPYQRLVSCFRNISFNKCIIIPSLYTANFATFASHVCGLQNHQRDCHYSSQWFFLAPWHKEFCFLGRCEHFSEHAHMLFSDLGARQDFLKKINGIKENHTGSYDWRNYFNQELADIVYQAYYPDFAAFGYHKDSWKKDFEEPYLDPIRNYDPTKDIERFRKWFPYIEEEHAD